MTNDEFLKVLPAYIGCKVQMEKSCYWLVHKHSIHKTSVIDLDYRAINDLFPYIDKIKFKLILRPLSEMTEDEEKDITATIDRIDSESILHSVIHRSAYIVNTLRSKGYDCDNLIDAGFAINKTK